MLFLHSNIYTSEAVLIKLASILLKMIRSTLSRQIRISILILLAKQLLSIPCMTGPLVDILMLIFLNTHRLSRPLHTAGMAWKIFLQAMSSILLQVSPQSHAMTSHQ